MVIAEVPLPHASFCPMKRKNATNQETKEKKRTCETHLKLHFLLSPLLLLFTAKTVPFHDRQKRRPTKEHQASHGGRGGKMKRAGRGGGGFSEYLVNDSTSKLGTQRHFFHAPSLLRASTTPTKYRKNAGGAIDFSRSIVSHPRG